MDDLQHNQPALAAPAGSPGEQPDRGAGRLYEAPRLIRYGHVKELTAGIKVGITEIALTSSIA